MAQSGWETPEKNCKFYTTKGTIGTLELNVIPENKFVEKIPRNEQRTPGKNRFLYTAIQRLPSELQMKCHIFVEKGFQRKPRKKSIHISHSDKCKL
jgi:hypothetical protein